MKRGRKSTRPFSSVVLTVLLILCCLLVISCGGGSPTPPPTSAPVIIPTATLPGPTPTEDSPAPTGKGIPWDTAGDHVGESGLICGPVAGTRYATNSKGAPTFLNLGFDYPNPRRFTILIWGKDRVNFNPEPENYYLGKTLCVTGLIELYRNILQVQVSRPMQIAISD